MSLKVTEEEVALAQAKMLSDDGFIEIIRRSLPFAWETVLQLVDQLGVKGRRFATVAPMHMAETDRAQLLRLFASNAMRGAVQRHFGITLAFQNCHAAAAVRAGDEGRTDFQFFCSAEGQIINQAPELVDC
jgi:hypothetical protein